MSFGDHRPAEAEPGDGRGRSSRGVQLGDRTSSALSELRRSRSMRVAVQDHRGTSRQLAQALFRAGHQAARSDAADLLLIDIDPPLMADRFDVPVFAHRQVIDHYKSIGAKVVMYSHGVNPALYYDGLFEPYEPVDIRLVHALGYAEFLRRVECPGEVRVIGWSLCDLLAFTPRRDVRRVLFAPLHPGGTGDTPIEASSNANAAVYQRLLAGPWQLTVRMIGTLEHNGLWPADGVVFVPGGLDLGLGDIHAADVVVAGAGTFPSVAIARGVPTVMYAHGEQAMYGLPGELPGGLLQPERYGDYIRYPFSVEDGPLDELVHAARDEEPILTWKRRYIGEPFDEAAAVAIVERTVCDAPGPPELASRRFAVAAFADELLERPELLAHYAEHFSPDDDVSLVLWGPGLDQADVLSMIHDAVRATGLDARRVPHLVALGHPDTLATDRLLADRAGALLSEWPACGRIASLPRYGAAETGELRVSLARLGSGSAASSRPV